MNSANPPRLAAWILQHFGPQVNSDALAGDLWEAFTQGQSKAWYWRQVLAAVRWRWLLFALLFSALMGWWLTSPILRPTRSLLSRSIDMAVIAVTYFASLFVPGMMRGRLRALMVLLIAAIFGLLWRYNPGVAEHDLIFFWMVASNFAFHRKAPASAPPPYHLSFRELLLGDPFAERKRMIAKLEQSMANETDPEVCHAYAESIAALRRNLPPAAKVVE